MSGQVQTGPGSAPGRGGAFPAAVSGLARFGAAGCLFLACACAASIPAERAGGPLNSGYEPGREFESQALTLLGVGFLLSEPLLAPGLDAPEARLLQQARALAEAARAGRPWSVEAAGLKPPSARRILTTAFSQVGRPYRHGGVSPQTGFDCSGFVSWVYGRHGIDLPRTSPEMMTKGRAVARPELAPGDLVFFGRNKRITHVGIYTGDNKYIHSPRSGKHIQESSLDDRSRGEYFAGARRFVAPDETWSASPAAGPGLDPSAPVLEGAALARAEAAPRLAGPAAPAKPKAKPPAASGKPAPPQKTKASAKTHKVKAGDTLFDLARKYGVSPTDLARANKLDKKQEALLRPGQMLTVPPTRTVH